MNRTLRSLRPLTLSLLALVALAGCNDDDNEDAIHPVHASFEVDPVSADPAVFFVKSPTDVNATDDIVVVDVMLRSTGGTTFSAFTMEIHFDPTVLQIGQLDLTATALGDCTSGAALHPICSDNIDPAPPIAPANDSGELLLGVSAQNGGPLASVTGIEKLFTLRFVGASVGTSDITFTQGAGSGDCEILDATPADLGITCESGAAHVVVAR